MQNTWYIAATCEELQPHKPLARTILNEEIVLYRDSNNQTHAMRDVCVHRGARLSMGIIEKDCLVCPFHGWHYDSSGKCCYIPANGPDSPIPSGAQLRSYPVAEKAGFIWVYMGSTDSIPHLKLPAEVDHSEWRGVPFAAIWKADLTRVVESILDVSHLPFVHPESTGEVNPIVEGPDFQVNEDEIVVFARPYHPFLQTPLNKSDYEETSTITFWYPNQMMLRTNMHQSNQMATFLSFTPFDDEKIGIYGLSLRNFYLDSEMVDSIHDEHTVTVLEQDRPIVESLRPRRSPLDLLQEQHVRSDSPQVRYRLMLRKKLFSDQQAR